MLYKRINAYIKPNKYILKLFFNSDPSTARSKNKLNSYEHCRTDGVCRPLQLAVGGAPLRSVLKKLKVLKNDAYYFDFYTKKCLWVFRLRLSRTALYDLSRLQTCYVIIHCVVVFVFVSAQ